MIDLGRRASVGAIRAACDVRLVELLLDDGDHAEALRWSSAAAQKGADAGHSARLRRLALDALFGLGRDRELLALLERHLTESSDAAALLREDPHLAFLEAAARARLEQPGWEDRFRTLAWSYKASSVHARAFTFLAEASGRLARFGGDEAELFRGKIALAEQRHEAAAVLLSDALRSLPAPAGSVVVEETARAFLALRRYQEGRDLLASVRPRVAEPWVVDEFEGRMLRASGARAEAALALETAVRTSPDAGQRQRALWHYLDLRIEAGETSLGRLIYNRREYVTDASYFEDLLEEAVTVLLESRSWRELELLRDFAREKDARQTLARVDFILARAVSAGMLEPTPWRDPDALLDEAIDAEPSGYHALLAGYLRSRSFRRADVGAGDQPGAEAGGPLATPTRRAGGVDDFVEGFFRYGLPLQGYRAVLDLGQSAPEETVLKAATELQASGYAPESIRLVGALTRRGDFPLERRHQLLQYPALYISDVERLAVERDLPVRAVLGLVREESLFDPDIVSRAGAVGLTQIMPATAEEVASRLGENHPDLTDPVTNLRLGLRHLAGLRTSTRSLVRAVIAYNAGLGRLRGWEREYGKLPDELLAEVIPFTETRLYVRHVVVAAVMYGALYDRAPPTETVSLFFPSLKPQEAL